MDQTCDILWLGKKDYKATYNLQKELLKERIKGKIRDQLILVEHEPVFTIGRGGSKENILVSSEVLERENISVYPINRGGDITYHGPGQIVGYPILDLKENELKDLHLYMRKIEEIFIRLLADYNIEAERKEGLTGVWVGEEKIVAIGIAAKSWVTYHGFAFNVEPNLEHFKLINPCGIIDKGVTSLEKLLTSLPDKATLRKQIIKYFAEIFNLKCEKKIYQAKE